MRISGAPLITFMVQYSTAGGHVIKQSTVDVLKHAVNSG